MKKILAFALLLCLLSIVFFEQIQTLLFSAGVSWYWSHFTPYLICGLTSILALTCLIAYKVKQGIKFLLAFIFISIPIILFAIHPIYAGDFTDDSANVIVKKLPSNEKDIEDGLLMISLGNCEYCYNAMKELMVVKKRAPQANMSIAVLTTNENVIDYYYEETDSLFSIFKVDSIALYDWSDLSPNQQFPCFLYIEDGKISKKWSNQQFGYSAKDFVERN